MTVTLPELTPREALESLTARGLDEPAAAEALRRAWRLGPVRQAVPGGWADVTWAAWKFRVSPTRTIRHGAASDRAGPSLGRLLDVYCGEGGIGWGYHLAGWDVTGVDKHPMDRYPFTFIQADALAALADPEFLAGFDAIHASPPCQFKATATLSQRMAGAEYPNLVPPTRKLLAAQRLPWVMENVPGAVRGDVRLCGCQFGLVLPGVGYLKRERWFETSWGAFELEMPHQHQGHAISIAGHGTPSWMRARTGHIGVAQWRELMEIPWMTREQLTEAVPPAYGRHMGELLAERAALAA